MMTLTNTSLTEHADAVQKQAGLRQSKNINELIMNEETATVGYMDQCCPLLIPYLKNK